MEAGAEKKQMSREESRGLLACVGTAFKDFGKGSASLGNKKSKTGREKTYRRVHHCSKGLGQAL